MVGLSAPPRKPDICGLGVSVCSCLLLLLLLLLLPPLILLVQMPLQFAASFLLPILLLLLLILLLLLLVLLLLLALLPLSLLPLLLLISLLLLSLPLAPPSSSPCLWFVCPLFSQAGFSTGIFLPVLTILRSKMGQDPTQQE